MLFLKKIKLVFLILHFEDYPNKIFCNLFIFDYNIHFNQNNVMEQIKLKQDEKYNNYKLEVELEVDREETIN